MQENGITIDKSFRGTLTVACRVDGKDCAIGSTDINGKVCTGC